MEQTFRSIENQSTIDFDYSVLIHFRDRVRTMINVLGDAYGAGIVEHLSKGDLAKADIAEREKLERERSGGEEENDAGLNQSSASDRVTTYC